MSKTPETDIIKTAALFNVVDGMMPLNEVKKIIKHAQTLENSRNLALSATEAANARFLIDQRAVDDLRKLVNVMQDKINQLTDHE